MDCWIVMGLSKLQNFGPPSYRFAAAMPVFHASGDRSQRGGMTGLTPTRRWNDKRQLTCREGTPKTRH
jgi:hypothetical protein